MFFLAGNIIDLWSLNFLDFRVGGHLNSSNLLSG